MSNISKPSVTKETSPFTEVVVVYRCFFEIGGVGQDGYTLALKITDAAGSNVALVENTDWKQTPMTNIAGDYEVRIGMSNFTTLGQYTIEVNSGNVDAGKLVNHFTLQGVYGMVNDGAPATTGFVTNLASSTTGFYNDAYLLMVSGSLVGCGPKKITAYSTGKAVTIVALPAAPANGDAFYIIRY